MYSNRRYNTMDNFKAISQDKFDAMVSDTYDIIRSWKLCSLRDKEFDDIRMSKANSLIETLAGHRGSLTRRHDQVWNVILYREEAKHAVERYFKGELTLEEAL
jgi:hypothetical protein